MRSTKLFAIIVGLALLAPAASAAPKQVDPKSEKKSDPDQPPKFPMSSAEFRPFINRVIDEIEHIAESEAPGIGQRMRVRASSVMEDGWVTQEECDYVLDAE